MNVQPALVDDGCPRILGLDLSITATGICDDDRFAFTVGGDAKLGDRRLVDIRNAVRNLATGAALALIEAPAFQSQKLFGPAMVHGAIRTLLLDRGIPYVLVNPKHLKLYATGKIAADKPAMALAAYKRAGIEFGDDNQCDAWWLRILGRDVLGYPLFDLPKDQRVAAAAVRDQVKGLAGFSAPDATVSAAHAR